jgi:hypothetical protein
LPGANTSFIKTFIHYAHENFHNIDVSNEDKKFYKIDTRSSPGPVRRPERAVPGDDDVVLLAELDHLLLGKVRMAFNLVRHRLDLEIFQKRFEKKKKNF